MENVFMLIFIGIIQAVFWCSILIYALSYTYIRTERFVDFDFPLEDEAREGEIRIGTIIHRNEEKYDYYLKIQDLERHMFISGATGSGKSNFFQNFIVELKTNSPLKDVPILLLEFKGEYHYLAKQIKDLLIYQVGNNFTINIFDPLGVHHDIHAERVFDIFKSGGIFEDDEYSPQMEAVFVEILQETIKDPNKRSWKAFYQEAENYKNRMKHVNKTYEGSVHAVKNRIRKYSLSTIAHIFDTAKGLTVKELFKRNILLDFSSMYELGGTKETALFFTNMIVKYLSDQNIKRGSRNYKGIRHIIIIEDAQYFASQTTTKKSKISAYIEDIALLYRGTGQCLISLATRPALSPEILANAGVFITFQNHMQKDYLQDLLNYDENKKKYLSMLDLGRCLIRVNSIGQPFEMGCKYVERHWLTEQEIEVNNQRALRNKGYTPQTNQLDFRDLKEPDYNNKRKKTHKKEYDNIMKKIRGRKEERERYKDLPQNYCDVCGDPIDYNKRSCEGCIIESTPNKQEKHIEKEIVKHSCLFCEKEIEEGQKFCEDCKEWKDLDDFVEDLFEKQEKTTKKKITRSV